MFFVPAFHQHLVQLDRAALTITGYEHDLSLFAQWFEQRNGEPLTPGALTATDGREYRQHLLTTAKLGPATVNRRLAAVRAYGAWAAASDQLDINPVAHIKNVAEQEHGPRWLTRPQQAALVRAAEKLTRNARTVAARQQAQRDETILILLLNTGLRISELCALQRSDVVISERKGTLRVRQGKGTRHRAIPLNAPARKVLWDWLKRPEARSSPFVFVGKKGLPLQSSGVWRRLAEFGRLAKVAVTPHALRHTFAKNLINAGVTLEKVAALMGHQSLNTTRLYTTPDVHDLEQAVATLND